jgi:hypothetical protein
MGDTCKIQKIYMPQMFWSVLMCAYGIVKYVYIGWYFVCLCVHLCMHVHSVCGSIMQVTFPCLVHGPCFSATLALVVDPKRPDLSTLSQDTGVGLPHGYLGYNVTLQV